MTPLVFDDADVDPIPIVLSETSRLTVLIIVWVPLTVRFPVTVNAPPTIASLILDKEEIVGPDVPNLFLIVSTFICYILLILF